MKKRIPRITIAGTSSGCGKTMVVCGILQALVNRGMKVAAFKCGPDYIDPMFHSRIIGAHSSNLDSFFFPPDTLKYLLAENASGCKVSVIEGVMGYYDGMDVSSERCSTYEIAQITDSPVILVVNARGAFRSVLAMIRGFLDFVPESLICGVILNQCTPMTYSMLEKAIQDTFHGKVEPAGYLPALPDCSLESRHLGLITAEEVRDLKEKLQILARQTEQTVRLDHLLEIAGQAKAVEYQLVKFPALMHHQDHDLVEAEYQPQNAQAFIHHHDRDLTETESVRIAVARDRAFCFYYEDSLDLLRKMGAELVSFSPLTDRHLPESVDGLYLGGGYPELYAQELSKNVSMIRSVRSALEDHLPCIAECGGMMYLTQAINDADMVGMIPGRCYNTGKLSRFGYVTLEAQKDNLLCRKGDIIRGHEFHYWDCEDPGAGFLAQKPSGRSWNCVHTSDFLYAGYPHFHFYSNPAFAERFYAACLQHKKREIIRRRFPDSFTQYTAG